MVLSMGYRMSEDRSSVSFLVGPKARKQIEDLKRDRGAATTSELIRDALRILATLEGYKEKDGTILLEYNGQKIKLIL